MIKKITITALIVFVVAGHQCFAQVGAQPTQAPTENKVMPASPEAASIAKFINFPVDYSTGVPNISIPLFDVKAGEIELPITLSYHAGGIKVNERSTWVGLGWSLSADPSISRTINGLADENHLIHQPSWPAQNDVINLSNYVYGILDADPDEFYYQLAHGGGKFYFNTSSSTAGYEALPVPYSPVKINISPGSAAANIKDVDGTTYYFGQSIKNGGQQVEYIPYIPGQNQAISTWKCTEIVSPSQKDTVFFTYSNPTDDETPVFNEKYEVYDSWTSGNVANQVNGQSTVDPSYWNYEPTSSNMAKNYPYMLIYPYYQGNPRVYNFSAGALAGWEGSDAGMYGYTATNNVPTQVPFTNYGGSVQPPGTPPYSVQDNYIKKVTNINYRSGSLKFFQDYHTVGNAQVSINRLDSIYVYDYNGKVVRKIKFYLHHIYPRPVVMSDHADYMDMLDSLIISGVDGTTLMKYKFAYNSDYGMAYGLKYGDAWGYYNGAQTPNNVSVNGTPLQAILTNNPTYYVNAGGGDQVSEAAQSYTISIGNSNRNVDPQRCQAFSLAKLYYPTGGRAEFTYESNQTLNGIAGGLRIKNIKYYSDDSKNIIMEKQYKYGVDENGYGFAKANFSLNDYTYAQTIYYLDPLLAVLHSNDGTTTNLSSAHTYFTEQKRTFLSQTMQQMAFSSGAPVIYNMVTEYQIDGGTQTGRTLYHYNYSDSVQSYTNVMGNICQQFNEWPWGQLLSTTKEAYLNGKFVWVTKDETSYQSYFLPNTKNIQIMKVFDTHGFWYGQDQNGGAANYVYDVLGQGLEGILTIYYSLNSGTELPSQERHYERDLNDTTHTTADIKTYYYDNPNSIYATRITYSDGQGNLKTDYITHPVDYASNDPMAGPMIANNMFDYPIETVSTIKKGSAIPVILSGEINTYSSLGQKLTDQEIEPLSPLSNANFKFSSAPAGQFPSASTAGLNLFSPDTGYQIKKNYLYDNNRGNLTQVTTNQTQSTAYIWDYNQLYPIAEIKNADNGDVAFTSFESNGTGNWNFKPSAISQTGGHTGNNCYNLSVVNPISKSNLLSAQNYIVSYWTKSANAYSIAGTVGAAVMIKSLNGWNFFMHKVTSQTTVTVTGNGVIDDVSLYPADGLMITFNYDPFNGITSSTDTKGETTYFNYDAFSRLSSILDQQGNFLKQFKYHYHYETAPALPSGGNGISLTN